MKASSLALLTHTLSNQDALIRWNLRSRSLGKQSDDQHKFTKRSLPSFCAEQLHLSIQQDTDRRARYIHSRQASLGSPDSAVVKCC